jgi:1,4-dihydroxy-2-naphthoate octaprenyltransferase
LVSRPLGLLVASFLWVNEFPDYRADLGAGKRNLVVRLGRAQAARVLVGIQLVTFLGIVVLPLAGVWLGLLALVPAAWATLSVRRQPGDFYRQHPVQPAFLLAFLLYAAGAGAGLIGGGALT